MPGIDFLFHNIDRTVFQLCKCNGKIFTHNSDQQKENGKGKQWSDNPDKPSGGNCLACHEMVKNDPSQGNIGPSLVDYGKLRGNSEAILKYTWGRIYDSAAYNACSWMPSFGAHHILTEQQMKDVMALLMDPKSPVNAN